MSCRQNPTWQKESSSQRSTRSHATHSPGPPLSLLQWHGASCNSPRGLFALTHCLGRIGSKLWMIVAALRPCQESWVACSAVVLGRRLATGAVYSLAVTSSSGIAFLGHASPLALFLARSVGRMRARLSEIDVAMEGCCAGTETRRNVLGSEKL
jgi:hypothetical protein